MNTIQIKSDGTPLGTTISLPDGQKLPGVTGISYQIAAGGHATASLDLCRLQLDARAEADLRPLMRAMMDAMDPHLARDFAAELVALAQSPADEEVEAVIAAGEFPGMTNQVAKDQPEYRTLPARFDAEADGVGGGFLTFCWKPTPAQVAQIVRTGCIWHRVMLCNSKLQPQLLTVAPTFTLPPSTES